jgi:hypothetical protein
MSGEARRLEEYLRHIVEAPLESMVQSHDLEPLAFVTLGIERADRCEAFGYARAAAEEDCRCDQDEERPSDSAIKVQKNVHKASLRPKPISIKPAARPQPWQLAGR